MILVMVYYKIEQALCIESIVITVHYNEIITGKITHFVQPSPQDIDQRKERDKD